MGSQGAGIGDNFKQSQFQPRGNSIYNLTLDEVQDQLGHVGKPVSSMNLDELLRNVYTADAHPSLDIDTEDAALQCQARLSPARALSKKTVDEVWRDIQQGKDEEGMRTREPQPTLGEMTLEDFLVKAGVVAESSLDKRTDGMVFIADHNVMSTFPHSGQWLQYQQSRVQHPQQGISGTYMPTQPVPQPLSLVSCSVMDIPYGDDQLNLTSQMMGSLSENLTPLQKISAPEDMAGRSVERRQKRMIKNRESAARSRARKQAYTNELELKVSRLEEENERLRKRKEVEKMISALPPSEPKYRLRRTSSGQF